MWLMNCIKFLISTNCKVVVFLSVCYLLVSFGMYALCKFIVLSKVLFSLNKNLMYFFFYSMFVQVSNPLSTIYDISLLMNF